MDVQDPFLLRGPGKAIVSLFRFLGIRCLYPEPLFLLFLRRCRTDAWAHFSRSRVLPPRMDLVPTLVVFFGNIHDSSLEYLNDFSFEPSWSPLWG